MTHRPDRGRLPSAAVLALLLPAACAAAAPATPPVSDGLVTEEVQFEGAQRIVGGTVYAPAAPGTGRPGIVLVSGAGAGLPREIYQPQAEAFARAGIVALVYDKRGTEGGYSLFSASLADLADDAIAGVQVLRARPDVDPGLVGIHGHSEGGWTVIEAATRSADVAFVVAAAPSALPPERTQVWMNETQLRHAGVAESLLAPLGRNLTRLVVAADGFRLAGYDPLPDLGRLDQPFLAVIAEYDRSAPPGETLELYRETLRRSGHPGYTLRVIEGVGHGLEPSADGFVEAHLDLDSLFANLAPAYVETVTEWVHALAKGPPPSSADPAPAQQHASTALHLPGAAVLAVQAGALAVIVLGFASYPVTAAIARLHGRRDPIPGRWPARTLAAVGLAVPPLAASYLGFVMLSGGTQPGPVLAGRPVLWLALQLAAAGAGATAAVVAAQSWRARHRMTGRDKVRLAALLTGAAVFLPWAAAWGLFTF